MARYPQRRHAARTSGPNTGGCVLDHHADFRFYSQLRGGKEEDFWVRFALAEVATTDIDGESIKQSLPSAGLNELQHLVGVLGGGRNRHSEAEGFHRQYEADCVGIGGEAP